MTSPARLALIGFFPLLVLACEGAVGGEAPSSDAGPRDSGGRDASEPTDAPPPEDAGAGTDAPDRELVPVSHERELRGVWIATVTNLTWPSSRTLSADAQRAELVALLDTMAATNLNALFLQIRPEGDAVYRSDLEPWSRYLTGTQGRDPGYDPLQLAIDEAHSRGIELHAWLNPYRAAVRATDPLVAPHMALAYPEHAHVYGTYLWMDPGATEVQQRTYDVVIDVVTRYAVDGIHFDDYFYPYPDGSTPFPDATTWNAYVASGGTLSRDDWRRDNVNRLVERLSDGIAAAKPHVRWGISPFGIYRPGMPPGITGLDQYAAIYADPVKWMRERWLDYIAPQLYWRTTQTAQAYEPLLEWWCGVDPGGPWVIAGNFLDRLGETGWTVDEFRAQLDISRANRAAGSAGNIFFTVKTLHANEAGVRDVFHDEYYARPALTPPLAVARDATFAPPDVVVEGTAVRVGHAEAAAVRAWVVYRDVAGAFEIDRIVPAATTSIELGSGRFAISAADLRSVESAGVVVELP